MLLLRTLLLIAGGLLFSAAMAVLAYEIYLLVKARDLAKCQTIRWREAARLSLLACVPVLLGLSITVVPSGLAGVRVSQISGTKPGTLYPGVHWITPLIDSVVLYDTREHMFTSDAGDPKKKGEPFKVQTKEGLGVGLSIAVRYRIDPRKLDSIHSNLPQPIGEEIVAPVVSSVFRDLTPRYMVRELFSTKREEVRGAAAAAIAQKLAADGIVVREVMLRDLVLPVEFAKGLEGMLLKEQENERLNFEVEIKQKQVRTAELEAEAEKARQVKQAEGAAQVTVLRAKADSDAMQYLLPLKEKQIQTTRLEAEARKETTVP
ncbi:MAG: prohibitin family protein [Bryobacteraceae bacterium]